MAAFDKVKSGIPSADQLLDHIRMGDNVVWSVSNLDEFRFFALPFVEQAIEDGRNLIYMRFANHEPILTPREGLKIYEFDPDKGFEAFTVDIYNRITAEGKDAFYVFDSLSSLQSVWYTDLMMGNFFRVTCPYLFRLDTVAYFPVIRGRHSFHAIAQIRDTTQLFLDVYSNSHSFYKLDKNMDPSAGLLRIVTGLGTRAVDRTENDYPRLVNLDRPAVSMYRNVAERHRFSQRNMDVLDITKNELTTISVDSLLEQLPLWFKRSVMERDMEAENSLKRMGRWRQVWFITCQKLLENKAFTDFMQKILKTLEKAYQNPVDIEYTVNLDENGDFVLNLVQCRPLFTGKEGRQIDIPKLPEDRIFFELKDSSMGTSAKKPIR